MKQDVWEILKKAGLIVTFTTLMVGWITTYVRFREYVKETKAKNEKFETYMVNQNRVNERVVVLYDLYFRGPARSTEEGAEEEAHN